MSLSKPGDFVAMPLDLFRAKDLTDALGVERAAAILNTTKRSIYTIRNTNVMSDERVERLREEIRKDEKACRKRLIMYRFKRAERAIMRDHAENTAEARVALLAANHNALAKALAALA